MSGNVVDAFFENQKHLATRFGIDLHFVIWVRRMEMKLDVARRQTVARKSSHPASEIDDGVELTIPSEVIARTRKRYRPGASLAKFTVRSSAGALQSALEPSNLYW